MDTTNGRIPSVNHPSTGIDSLPPERLRLLRLRYEQLLRRFGNAPIAAYLSGVIAAIDRQLRQEPA
jgi:hypothetical protein